MRLEASTSTSSSVVILEEYSVLVTSSPMTGSRCLMTSHTSKAITGTRTSRDCSGERGMACARNINRPSGSSASSSRINMRRASRKIIFNMAGDSGKPGSGGIRPRKGRERPPRPFSVKRAAEHSLKNGKRLPRPHGCGNPQSRSCRRSGGFRNVCSPPSQAG